jgi:predicted PurR-regulated permease PerM
VEDPMSNLRKKYVVNRKFQLRTTFAVIGFIFVILALLVSLAGINILDINTRISNMIEINKAIADTLAAPTPNADQTEYQNYVRMQNLHDQNKHNLDEMIKFNTILITIIITVVFIQGFVLFFLLIRQTHRIAGPIYVMTNYMRLISEGKVPEHVRALRKNDFFQDSYEVFKDMVKSLKEKERK